jgi:Ca-activated chloride channel homolog
MRRAGLARIGWVLVALALGLGGAMAQTAAPVPAAAAPGLAANPVPNKRAVVVLDSSALMLAPLDRFKKYYLVRKNLQLALTTPPTGVDVGLVAYGHRRRAACDDVEVLQPVAPFDPRTFFRGLMSVRPKGQAALSEGLKLAALTLNTPGSGPVMGGKILLIAGSPDSCQADPCATAGALVAANPGLSIDVVWMADPAPDLAQAQCIAKAGNGKLYTAVTKPDSEQMLVAAFAGLSAPPELTAPPVAQGGKGVPGLNLSVSLGGQAGLYAGKAAWTVRKSDANGHGQVVAQADTASAFLPLPAGAYDVEVAAGGLSKRQTMEIGGSDPTALAMTLDAGTLQLRIATAKTPQPGEEPFATVYRLGASADDSPETVAVVPVTDRPLVLPAGAYRIVTSLHDLQAERTVTLGAGAAIVAEFSMTTGVLQIETPPAAGGAATASSTAYFVSEDDPDLPLGQRDVGRSALPNPSFDLKPGLYHVYAREGAAQARVDVVVKAGEITRVALPIVTGRLIVLPMGKIDGSEIPKEFVSYTIERLAATGNTGTVVARSSLSQASLDLEAGRYRVTGRVGLVNVVAATEAIIRAGAETRIELRPSLALLSLNFGDDPESALDVLWEVRAPDSKVVWATTGATPLVPLAPGDYEVHAYRAGRDRSQAVTLTANEHRTVVIRPE